MVYGYIRISTDKQDYKNQKFGILAFGNEKGLGQIKLIEETVSGRVSWKKRELGWIVERMEKGDTLIVSELSRLGRSLLEVMELLAELMRREVTVKSKLDGKEDEIRRLLGLRVPKTVIARLLSVSRPALYDFIESRSIDTGSVRM